MILEGLDDITLKYSFKFNFRAMNNQVEYEALVANLQLAKEVGVRTLNIKSDSQLVITQIKGEYKVKGPLLANYVQVTQRLLEGFNYDLERIPKEENGQVDALAKLASIKATINNRMIIQEMLHTPCIKKVMYVEIELSWMTPIMHYLKMGKLT